MWEAICKGIAKLRILFYIYVCVCFLLQIPLMIWDRLFLLPGYFCYLGCCIKWYFLTQIYSERIRSCQRMPWIWTSFTFIAYEELEEQNMLITSSNLALLFQEKLRLLKVVCFKIESNNLKIKHHYHQPRCSSASLLLEPNAVFHWHILQTFL